MFARAQRERPLEEPSAPTGGQDQGLLPVLPRTSATDAGNALPKSRAHLAPQLVHEADRPHEPPAGSLP